MRCVSSLKQYVYAVLSCARVMCSVLILCHYSCECANGSGNGLSQRGSLRIATFAMMQQLHWYALVITAVYLLARSRFWKEATRLGRRRMFPLLVIHADRARAACATLLHQRCI
jgi:hypothetical protein